MGCSRCGAPVSNAIDFARYEWPLRPVTYGLSAYLFTKLQLPTKLSFLQLCTQDRALVTAAVVAGAVDGSLTCSVAITEGSPIPAYIRFLWHGLMAMPAALLTASIATLTAQRSLSWRLLKDIPQVSLGAMAVHGGIGMAINTARYVWPHTVSPIRAYLGRLYSSDSGLDFHCPKCETHWDTKTLAAYKMCVAALFSGILGAYGLSRLSHGMIRGYRLPLPPNIPMLVWAGGGLLTVVGKADTAWNVREPDPRRQTIEDLIGLGLSGLSVYLLSKRMEPVLSLSQAALVGSAAYIVGAMTERVLDRLITDAYHLWPHCEPRQSVVPTSQAGQSSWAVEDCSATDDSLDEGE